MPPKLPPSTPPATTRPLPTSRTRTTTKRKEHVAKTFSVQPWTGEGEGEKIIMYGRSGIGKTTIATMAPNPVFIGIDDGGRKIVNPLTQQPINAIPGIQTFRDIRDALAQKGLFPDKCTIVIDTISKLEELLHAHILSTVTIKGQLAKTFRMFGWDGDRHILDHMRLLLSDLDRHVREGRNVILLAQQGQIKVANAEGADYLEDGPFLQHRNDCSTREEVKQWADHVFRVAYLDMSVGIEKGARAGKVTSDDTTRAVFCGGAQYFTAKTRPINGKHLPSIVSFESLDDNSLWEYMFGGALENTA